LLEEIRAAAADALAFAGALSEAEFSALPDTDRRTYRAQKNALSEIVEAVKLLPPEIPARHSHVDWRGWAGLRDVVAHQYFRLEAPRLRPTVTQDLPLLMAAILFELSRLERER
jgi:uncharacterized protein with HEPN domain